MAEGIQAGGGGDVRREGQRDGGVEDDAVGNKEGMDHPHFQLLFRHHHDGVRCRLGTRSGRSGYGDQGNAPFPDELCVQQVVLVGRIPEEHGHHLGAVEDASAPHGHHQVHPEAAQFSEKVLHLACFGLHGKIAENVEFRTLNGQQRQKPVGSAVFPHVSVHEEGDGRWSVGRNNLPYLFQASFSGNHIPRRTHPVGHSAHSPVMGKSIRAKETSRGSFWYTMVTK